MILFLSSLGCPKTIFENQTKYPWNQRDYSFYKVVTKRCGKLYEQSPCVKIFYKKGQNDYSVICGR